MLSAFVEVLIVLVFIVFGTSSQQILAKDKVIPSWQSGHYPVTQVVDGDTIKVRMNGKEESIRILGIDTPEKYPTRTGYEECYGQEASEYATRTLSGVTVKLLSDPTQDGRDTYGRILANVFLPNETLYGEKAISEGYAFRYVYNKKPTRYDLKLKKAEAVAKRNNVGVWKMCDGKRKPMTVKPVALPVRPLAPVPPTTTPIPVPEPTSDFSCSVPKTVCAQMLSCSEARFYLTSCGVNRLDGDRDGMPCESICK